eukprot:TRINITY_DN28747_c0_g1_i1.p1 TRINITY_DN28747_c0_g1~~TRINITY_DN28747_c0_g1_i1.p1  ORF type:complete len:1001 (-),score=129.18 TRINITY_DN28747_c0_g1_i1:45-3020(-)
MASDVIPWTEIAYVCVYLFCKLVTSASGIYSLLRPDVSRVSSGSSTSSSAGSVEVPSFLQTSNYDKRASRMQDSHALPGRSSSLFSRRDSFFFGVGDAQAHFAFDQRRPPGEQVRNSSFSNYICYMQVSRDMFVVLSVFSVLILVFVRGFWPVYSDLRSGSTSGISKLDDEGSVRLFVLLTGLLYGAIIHLFANLLQRCQWETEEPIVDKQSTSLLDRTMWVKWLPTGDKRRGTKFLLDHEEIASVAADLGSALDALLYEMEKHSAYKAILESGSNMEVFRRMTTPTRSRTKNIHSIMVTPHVAEWQVVSQGLRDAKERVEAYTEFVQGADPASWRGMYFKRKLAKWEEQVSKLRLQLLIIQLSKKSLCGSAFVTFKHSLLRDKVLNHDPPRCWELKRYILGGSYFTFGRPPFSSVTLRIEKAVHPNDVRWCNLHVSDLWHSLHFTFLVIVLMLIMMVLLNHKQVALLVDWWVKGRSQNLVKQAPQAANLLTLFINNLVLPQLIYWIALWERSKTWSAVTQRQLILNFIFLLFNLMVLPIFATESFMETAEIAIKYGNVTEILAARLCEQGGKGEFSDVNMKYLTSSAFITTGLGLLAPLRIEWTVWIIFRFIAVTPQERKEALKPPEFCWGYWYANGLALMMLSLITSFAFPFALPVTALAFHLKRSIDFCQLDRLVWDFGPENKCAMLFSVVALMRVVVALFWLLMSTFFLASTGCSRKMRHVPSDYRDDNVHWMLGDSIGIMFLVLGTLTLLHSIVEFVMSGRSRRNAPRSRTRAQLVFSNSRVFSWYSHVCTNFMQRYFVKYVDESKKRASVFMAKPRPSSIVTWDVMRNPDIIFSDEVLSTFRRRASQLENMSSEKILSLGERHKWTGDKLMDFLAEIEAYVAENSANQHPLRPRGNRLTNMTDICEESDGMESSSDSDSSPSSSEHPINPQPKPQPKPQLIRPDAGGPLAFDLESPRRPRQGGTGVDVELSNLRNSNGEIPPSWR